MITPLQALVVIAGVVFAAGCGGTAAPSAPPSAASNVAPAPETKPELPAMTAQDALAGLEAEVSGMDLYMHDIAPTGDTRRKPTLWVHASKGSLDADKSWVLADARAIIYRDQDADIALESTAGRFDESKKIAVLEGGVRVSAGTLRMQTESVRYDNSLRYVETLAPVELADGTTVLTAEKASLEPDEGHVTLTNVSGTLSLAGEPE